jgi:D-glycero-D-manno-heptose 1,7-bisphosphate phosphatase
MNKAVFLDRDGVLTCSKTPPENLQDIKMMPKIEELLQYLNCNNFLIFCITNQPEISRGTKTLKEAQEVNDILWANYPEIIKFEICPHSDEDNCVCRKPKTGMIISLAKEFDIDISKSWMIGDRWRDIGAGLNAGCKTIFFNYRSQGELRNYIPDFTAKNVKEIINIFERNIT